MSSTSNPSKSGSPEDETRERSAKTKRHQIARACDWCRVHRIKCDNNSPCNNCRARRGHCSGRTTAEVRSLPHAYREIERLRNKLGELQLELDNERQLSRAKEAERPQPLDLLSIQYSRHEGQVTAREGVYMCTAHLPNKTWYGTSSRLFFISRMNEYLTTLLPNASEEDRISRLESVATNYTSPDCVAGSEPQEGVGFPNDFLTPTQEEYFLNLFWESHHTSLLLINEAEFKQHYKSLWHVPGRNRRNSAIVDAVIALSMQYGMSKFSGRRTTAKAKADFQDSTIAGRAYYQRCQTLLVRELESPTLNTLRCHVLTVIYLCCASFQNMAHSTLAIAVRTAQMLGLHQEPPSDLPAEEQEMRKRIWWTLYVVETKTCMKLGREFTIDLSSTSVSLPADDHETAMSAGSMYSPLSENVSWLTYNLLNVRLVRTARDVHLALYREWAAAYPPELVPNLYRHKERLERVARFLTTVIQPLHAWARAVPPELKTQRKGGGEPFSTDCSLLHLELFSPMWVNRQRLLLELLYHNLCMNLYRPMMTFPGSSPSEETCAHSRSAALHAMALTCMMHQMATEQDVLTGWHEAFQWQWNASITLSGYVLAYPASDITPSVRDAVDKSNEVFDAFGQHFAVANSAATVARDLAAKVDAVTLTSSGCDQGYQLELSSDQLADTQSLVLEDHSSLKVPAMPALPMGATFSDGSFMAINGPIEMAYQVDTFHNTELLWPTQSNDESSLWYQDFHVVPAEVALP